MEKSLSKKLREGNNPFLIMICGMPGTRKSSTAVKLGSKLGFASVVGLDELREVVRFYDKNPLLQGTTHDRWQVFGNLNDKNFFKGFLGQSKALKATVTELIKLISRTGENTIIEGVHLVPSLYDKIPSIKKIHFLLTAKNLDHHKKLLSKKFGRRHGVQQPWGSEKIGHVERIQNYLIKDARRHNVEVITSTTPEENCRKIISYMKKYLNS